MQDDANIQRKIDGCRTKTLTVLNEEIKDFMKIVKSLKESGLETKERMTGFLGILSGICYQVLVY